MMIVFLSLLLAAAAPVKIETGRFNILKDGQRIGTDEFSVEAKGKNYLVEGKSTISGVTVSSRMELDGKLVPISYEVSNREGSIRLQVASPVSELESNVAGEKSSADFRFPDGGVILDNNFFHHYLILLYRAQMGQTAFGVFVPQDRTIGTATVQNTGARTYNIDVGDVRMQATTDAEGSLIRLTVPSANVVVER